MAKEIASGERANLQRVFDAMKEIRHVRGLVDGTKDYIDIKFNEFLHIEGDTDTLYINDNKSHVHFDGDVDAVIEWLTGIAKGDIVFIEDRRWFMRWSSPNLKQIPSIEFEKNNNKGKYLRKKYLRIYSGFGIIKRAVNDKMPPFEKVKTLPPPPVNDDAVDVVWNGDKTAYCEIICENNAYKARGIRYLGYGDLSGYFGDTPKIQRSVYSIHWKRPKNRPGNWLWISAARRRRIMNNGRN